MLLLLVLVMGCGPDATPKAPQPDAGNGNNASKSIEQKEFGINSEPPAAGSSTGTSGAFDPDRQQDQEQGSGTEKDETGMSGDEATDPDDQTVEEPYPDLAEELVAAGLISKSIDNEKVTWSDPSSGQRLVRMDEICEVWINPESRQILVGARVCFREGALEMMAVPSGTKEHESILAVHSNAALIHRCMLALKCEPGSPVSYVDEFRPPTGPTVKFDLRWVVDKDPVTCRAQEWVVDSEGKQMTEEWVFAGSETFLDETSGRMFYGAESGELICLANFPRATFDLPIASTDAAQGLLYFCNTEKIPQLGTRVLLIISPPEKTGEENKSENLKSPESDKQPNFLP